MRAARAALRQICRPLQTPIRPVPGRTWHRSYATTVSAADLEFGQPVYETHPHILKPGEITPGISAQEYADRRAKLAFSLPENGVALLPSAELKYRSGAVFFPFRQESNFLYLTGFSEPEALAVICKTGPNLGDYSFHLFCRPKDAFAEQWSGPWSGLRAAEDVFNADTSSSIHDLTTLLPLLRSASRIYTDHPANPTSPPLTTILRTLPSPQPRSPLVNSSALSNPPLKYPSCATPAASPAAPSPPPCAGPGPPSATCTPTSRTLSPSTGLPLRAGHCVTIEPGVYVPDDERFPKHFRGLAVRIEDSVAVDEEGPVVLTVEAVKEVEDIEALR
ncbi:aminopeptidase [Collariella sp. IMI 366227]|nr:aminopeptidase [Collariella sp. IMI 366227]